MKYKNTTFRKFIATLFLTVLLLAGTTHVMSVQVAHAQAVPAKVEPKAVPKVDPDAKADPAAPAASGTVGSLLGSSGTKSSVIVSALAEILALVLRMISQLLWPLLMLAGGLMKSDFLYTGAIDLKLSELWIQVRNLVNIAYVIMLLAVALYNVIGLGEMVSVLELKKALPKIMLGLVLVNFSYAGVKVVLDVVNVGTTFAFSIGRTDARLTADTKIDMNKAQEPICKVIGNQAEAAGNAAAGFEGPPKKAGDAQKESQANAQAALGQICVDGKFTAAAQKYIQGWGADGALMTIAVKFMNIQDLGQVTKQMSTSGGLNSLTIGMLFSVVMYLIYGVSFAVLVVVLFSRAAMLWMVIVFSPFLVFNLTFPNLIPAGGDLGGKITKTLIAPIIIGFVLSIGYILLSTMQQTTGSLMIGAPTTSIDTFQGLIVAIGSVVFVWMGINSAVNGTIGETVSTGIMTSAKDAGTWLAKAPFKYAPMFQVKTPHGTHSGLMTEGRMLGFDQVNYAIDQLKSKHEQDRRAQVNEIFNLEGVIKLENMNQLEDIPKAMKNYNLQDLRNPNSDQFKKMEMGVKRIDLADPNLRINDPKFKELYEAIKEKDQTRLDRIIPQYRGTAPAGGTAAAAPAATTATTAAPKDAAGVATQMKADANMSAALGKIKDGHAPTDVKTLAVIINKYQADLHAAGVKNPTDKAKAIAKFFTENEDSKTQIGVLKSELAKSKTATGVTFTGMNNAEKNTLFDTIVSNLPSDPPKAATP